jgi:DNA-binding response OmpR family regulator
MRMPGMDGPALFGELLNRFPDASHCVIFSTGDVISDDTQEFLEATGRPSLMKPFAFGELGRVVDAVLKQGDVLTGRR